MAALRKSCSQYLWRNVCDPHEKEELISDTVAYLVFDDMVIIVMSNKNGKLFMHQTRVIATNTCLNLN